MHQMKLKCFNWNSYTVLPFVLFYSFDVSKHLTASVHDAHAHVLPYLNMHHAIIQKFE